MTTIIVKKHTAKLRFHPHYNRTTGRYYGSEGDYTADLKKRGLEPYNPEGVQKRPDRKSYKPSEWAHQMVNAAVGSNGKVKVGDRWIDEVLKDNKPRPMPDSLPEIYRKQGNKGGTY